MMESDAFGPSKHYKSLVLDATLRGIPFRYPATLYVGLLTMRMDGSRAEPSDGAYARRPISFSPALFGRCENDAPIEFALATDNWGMVVGMGIFDAEQGGDAWFTLPLVAPQYVQAGDLAHFNAGDVQVAL